MAVDTILSLPYDHLEEQPYYPVLQVTLFGTLNLVFFFVSLKRY